MRESTAEFRAHQPVLTARSAARSALDCRAGPRALINMEGSAFEASRGAHPSLLPTIPATLRPSLLLLLYFSFFFYPTFEIVALLEQ